MSSIAIILLIFSTAFLGLALYQYAAFIRLYYTELSFSKFRELRFESIEFIISNLKNENITVKELEEHNDFLKSTDSVIEHFDKIKTKLSKFESVKLIYRNIVFSSERYEKIQLEESQSLSELKIKFADAILTSFKAIPFFKERLIIHLLSLILSILVSIGFIKLKKTMERIERLYSIERKVIDDKNCFS